MKTVITASLCLLVSAAALGDEFSGVKRLDLRISSGNVQIKGVDGATASVSVNKKRYDERCRLVIDQEGDTLRVELKSKELFGARCEADFTIAVPKAAALRIHDGSGDISLIGCTGTASIDSGSGNVKAEGLRAPASVRTGSGKMRLAFEEVPAEGQLEIQSGSGDAEVLFPKKSRIRTSFSAGSGRLKNSLGESSDARFTVSMKTGSGSLTVGKF